MIKEKIMKLLSKALVLLIGVLVIAGCSPTTDDPKDQDKVLIVAKSSDVISLDTHLATDGVSFEVIKTFTEGLIEYDAAGKLTPGVATTWDVSEDGKEYTFNLRDDSVWSNGTKVTAADFVFGFQRLADPVLLNQYSYLLSNMKIVNADEVIAGTKPLSDLGVKAVDDTTFVVTLTDAVPYFLQLMTFPSFNPVNEEFATSVGDEYATAPDKLISNGAFVLKEWLQGSRIKLDKNDTYWDKDNVDVDGLEFQIFKDYQSAALEFESGNVDVTAITSNIVDRYRSNEGYTEVKLGYLWFISPNQLNETMKNKNLRLALAHAFDRDHIANNLLGDGSIVATGIVASGLVTGPDGSDFRDASGVYQKYDVAKAQAFWADAKKELGVETLTIELLVGSPETDTGLPVGAAEFLKGEFETNLEGLTVEIKTTIKSDRLDLMNAADYQLGITRWGPDFADPLTFLKDLFETGSPYNYPKFSNAEYDALLEEVSPGGALASNLEARWDKMIETEALLLNEGGVIPAWQTGSAMLIAPNVSGIEYHVVGMPRYKNATKSE
jgi:oligopeptide transport system substrate-binding protein